MTFGFIDVEFDIRPWRVLRGRSQAELKDHRGQILEACKRQAQEDGEPLEGYDQIIAFVHKPGCNAGAVNSPGDAVLDQHAYMVYYQHEVGHVLGFAHSFGPKGVYDNEYCVMGWTSDPAPGFANVSTPIPVPPDFANLHFSKPPFWVSDRALSAASLYRYLPEFAQSDRVVRIDHSQGARIVLKALTHGHWGGTLLAVLPVDVEGFFYEFTVEYRDRFGDDQGLRPAVVVHSIGSQQWPDNDEVKPVCLEAVIDAVTGTTRHINQDLRVEITDSTNEDVGVYLTWPDRTVDHVIDTL
jgi:hypothetical protein